VGGSGGRITCYLNGYPGHTGIDIGISGGYGTPVLASAGRRRKYLAYRNRIFYS
jgi:murein DD-endopeptidase MepM/ murein hydrolase activator NlpD